MIHDKISKQKMPAQPIGVPDSPSLAIAKRSLSEPIYISLRDAIISGKHRPGEALRQEALAKSFDVSRVPVREALQRLEAVG